MESVPGSSPAWTRAVLLLSGRMDLFADDRACMMALDSMLGEPTCHCVHFGCIGMEGSHFGN